MGRRQWSRRDTLKSLGVGALGLGVGAAVYHRLGRYIVGTSSEDGVTAAASLSESDHDEVDLTDHTSLRLVSGLFPTERGQSLRSRTDVEFVQPDRTLTPLSGSGTAGSVAAETVPWGIDRVDADVAHDRGVTGAGVDVGVIDTGIDGTHPDLRGNVADPDDGNHEAWVDCSGGDCTHAWSDDSGHGTHVSGTVAADGDGGCVGVAPEATLHALKVCGASGGCDTSAVVDAIRYAADQGWDVVNLSLGSPRESPAMQTAGQYAREAGVVPVAAAGNRGAPDSVGYPAAYEAFLAVSATNIDDGMASFSSLGPEVEIAAPGAEVCSTVPGEYELLSGTSMAAPHVAGALATLLADGYSPSEAQQRLLESAEDLGHPDTDQGNGLLDVAAALGFDSGDDGTGDGIACPA